MMAINSPLMPSPNSGLMSAFSPYTDSPSSPAPYHSLPSRFEFFRLWTAQTDMNRHSDPSGHLYPPQSQRSPMASNSSDICDPSPVAPSSNGTDTTEIDDSAIDLDDADVTPQPQATASLESQGPQLKLETADGSENVLKPASAEDDQPSSVIHVPRSFELFHTKRSPPSIRHSTPTPSQRSDITTIAPKNDERRNLPSPPSPHPLTTSAEPSRDWSATPRAHTRQEAEALEHEKTAMARSSSLEDIPEANDTNHEDSNRRDSLFDTAVNQLQQGIDEVAALKLALGECWTLCNTLAGLSYIHRERIFSHKSTGDNQEKAWKSCWQLCRKLYETQDDEHFAQVPPTLDLCRDFCQALFEVRQKENDIADSVLRVSFELNNHLYNTHDRTLPEAFRERTLDFYITLCHRLMKQRTRHGHETDSLLHACWSLAEMLFSLRQNKRDGKPADGELLGSAVQSCWELCDLFREGWTQIRPDRVTPRPSQTTFTQAFQQAKQSETASTVSVGQSEIEDDEFGRLNPETPTTIFEDTQQMSPDEAQAPNIFILGPESNNRFQQVPQWSSSSSTLSGYSHSSANTTSSTSTVMNPSEDYGLTCLRLLIIRAAMNVGFQRSSRQTFPTFCKALSSNSFGTAQWQISLLEKYKKLVANDPTFKSVGPPQRASAADVARAVAWMVRGGQYAWLKDLFRLVCGFHFEEAAGRKGVWVQS